MTQTITFTIPRNEWLSSNDRYGHWATRSRTKALKHRAFITVLAHIRKGKLHPVTRATVTATIGYPSQRKADPHNAAPTVKALIDGCTDAGLWPDDNSDVLPLIAFGRANTKAPKHTHLVTLYLTNLEIEYERKPQCTS